MEARDKSFAMGLFVALMAGSCGGYAVGSRDADGLAKRSYELGRKSGIVQGHDQARIERIPRRIYTSDAAWEGAKAQAAAER